MRGSGPRGPVPLLPVAVLGSGRLVRRTFGTGQGGGGRGWCSEPVTPSPSRPAPADAPVYGRRARALSEPRRRRGRRRARGPRGERRGGGGAPGRRGRRGGGWREPPRALRSAAAEPARARTRERRAAGARARGLRRLAAAPTDPLAPQPTVPDRRTRPVPRLRPRADRGPDGASRPKHRTHSPSAPSQPRTHARTPLRSPGASHPNCPCVRPASSLFTPPAPAASPFASWGRPKACRLLPLEGSETASRNVKGLEKGSTRQSRRAPRATPSPTVRHGRREPPVAPLLWRKTHRPQYRASLTELRVNRRTLFLWTVM